MSRAACHLPRWPPAVTRCLCATKRRFGFAAPRARPARAPPSWRRDSVRGEAAARADLVGAHRVLVCARHPVATSTHVTLQPTKPSSRQREVPNHPRSPSRQDGGRLSDQPGGGPRWQGSRRSGPQRGRPAAAAWHRSVGRSGPLPASSSAQSARGITRNRQPWTPGSVESAARSLSPHSPTPACRRALHSAPLGQQPLRGFGHELLHRRHHRPEDPACG